MPNLESVKKLSEAENRKREKIKLLDNSITNTYNQRFLCKKKKKLEK